MNPSMQRSASPAFAAVARTTESRLSPYGNEASVASADEPAMGLVVPLPIHVPDEPPWAWKTALVATLGAGPNARLRIRPRLSVAAWSGDIDAAAQITDKVVDNAVSHAKPFDDGKFPLRAFILPTNELVIEVDDQTPEFPGFAEAISWKPTDENVPPCGLWWVRRYGGRLSYAVLHDGDRKAIGKTVQVLLPATPEVSA
ncbi:hypothetical protein [Streptomyces sp. NPDC059010]|uniref:hypothetical protein n=1 Tax=Streptomyces sp. NPDC059010 TaxID=3346695 RepID=UPI00369B393E